MSKLDETEKSVYRGVVESLKDQQKILNTCYSSLCEIKDFDQWFNNYSFAYLPSFCKPLVRRWIYAGWCAGREQAQEQRKGEIK